MNNYNITLNGTTIKQIENLQISITILCIMKIRKFHDLVSPILFIKYATQTIEIRKTFLVMQDVRLYCCFCHKHTNLLCLKAFSEDISNIDVISLVVCIKIFFSKSLHCLIRQLLTSIVM